MNNIFIFNSLPDESKAELTMASSHISESIHFKPSNSFSTAQTREK